MAGSTWSFPCSETTCAVHPLLPPPQLHPPLTSQSMLLSCSSPDAWPLSGRNMGSPALPPWLITYLDKETGQANLCSCWTLFEQPKRDENRQFVPISTQNSCTRWLCLLGIGGEFCFNSVWRTSERLERGCGCIQSSKKVLKQTQMR